MPLMPLHKPDSRYPDRTLRTGENSWFLSTHVMDVAEKVCDRVGIIHKGQLKVLGTVDELTSVSLNVRKAV